MNIDNNLEQKIIECMNNIGIITLSDDLNFNLSDYIVDSIMFVSFIIELEQTFNVEIPDEYLISQKLQTFNDIKNMIEHLLMTDCE